MASPTTSPRSALRRLAARAGRGLTSLAAATLVAACAASPSPPPPCPSEPATQAIAGGDLMGLPAAATSDAIPVGADDPQRGRADALVTIVAFGDFQCPFCARANPTLDRLAETYGPEQVRIVWKHLPLPFHVHARPIAEMSAAIMKLGGSDAFWRFHRRAFEGGGRHDDASVGELARSSGYDARTLAQAIAEHGADKVRADEQLAARMGVRGTPGFLINGVFLSGAQPYERFAEIVDAEVAAAKRSLADGTPRGRLYAARVAENLAKNPPTAVGVEVAEDPPEDRTVWAVPVDGSPVLGKPDALVTIVQLTDYQCPFCARANGTMAELRKKYGDQIRIVHKHRPLPFHPQARPASELALEILARKGNDAFWKASDLLFAMQGRMRPSDGAGGDALHPEVVAAFGDVAEQLGVPRAQALAAVKARRHEARIAKDEMLGDDLEAGGTPTFFINGRRLTGAQPIGEFEELIDAELAKAKTLVAGGTPPAKLYEQIVAIGKKGALQLETIDLPAPTTKSPARGPVGAPVIVQVFSDFECPFCRRFAATMDELADAYPTQVRIVFRHLPLSMHANAHLAAEASMEAFAQGGSRAFWRMHDALFEAAGRGDSLDRQALEAAARTAGVDTSRLRAALDDGRHRAAVDADVKVADEHRISGTPTIVVGRYVVSGAQPLTKFRRAVEKVLAEQKEQRAAAAVAR
jgi:protein-disulfide isomerase